MFFCYARFATCTPWIALNGIICAVYSLIDSLTSDLQIWNQYTWWTSLFITWWSTFWISLKFFGMGAHFKCKYEQKIFRRKSCKMQCLPLLGVLCEKAYSSYIGILCQNHIHQEIYVYTTFVIRQNAWALLFVHNSIFTRATHSIARSLLRQRVRLSHAGIVSKRLNLS